MTDPISAVVKDVKSGHVSNTPSPEGEMRFYACTSGPGFFRYCVVIALADQ